MAEIEFTRCETCDGHGLVAGDAGENVQCSTCGGQGAIRKIVFPVAVGEEPVEIEPARALEDLTKAELIDIAEGLGLERETGRPTNARLIERIREAQAAVPPTAEELATAEA